MPHFRMDDQAKLYVRIIGQGKSVLVLSGLGMSSWQWLGYLLPFLKQRQFIIPDYRGFGGSKNCQIPQYLDAISSHWQDINSLIKQLKEKKYIKDETLDVMAYSMGATITMHGLKYGHFAEKIDHYLHIDQSSKIKNDASWQYGLYGSKQADFLNIMAGLCDFLRKLPSSDQYLSQLSDSKQKELSELWFQFLAVQKSSALQVWLNRQPHYRLKNRLLPLQSIAYILWYLDSYLQHDEDYRDALAHLERPSTFIIGRKSELYDYRGQVEVAKKLKQHHIEVFKYSGHAPLLTQPLKFTKILGQFLLPSN